MLIMDAKFECEFCGNNFITKKELHRHQKTAAYCLKEQGKNTFEFKCNYCDATFNKIINLERHQKGAKYCLEKQGKIAPTEKRYACSTCPKKFLRIDNYKRHVSVCSEKAEAKKVEYAALKEDIDAVKRDISRDKKKDKMELLAEIKAITDQELKDCLEHLSLSFIKGGARGLANYANTYPFNNKVICTDRARGKLNYRFDKDSHITCDTGILLSRKFFESIKEKSNEIIDEEYSSILEKITNTTNISDTLPLMEKATELQSLRVMCSEAANGHDNELTVDFLKYLTRMVT